MTRSLSHATSRSSQTTASVTGRGVAPDFDYAPCSTGRLRRHFARNALERRDRGNLSASVLKKIHDRYSGRLAGGAAWQRFHLRPLPQLHGSLRPRLASAVPQLAIRSAAGWPARSRPDIARIGSLTWWKKS